MSTSNRMAIECPECGHEIDFEVRSRIPKDTAAILRQLRDDPARLNNRLAELRREGYTLQALGNAIGVTRERVRQRVNTADRFGGV